ncbi:hypothetical protein EPVG_00412 [Emiliania huxleyi virus 201]|nr:hypothetical protein ELVG_00445 [Emiliania huxleyi virus 203]AEP15821.1 hypothetical protein EQVG_00412 [Emiliania huxleyi virus 207]AEP16233.1 hypothetical protein ERVG_00358 [Emiliania huxleyi virus 208]AET98299.1 hypothetical protein EPVG_00412 [Emiliania huxleyi virus 201]
MITDTDCIICMDRPPVNDERISCSHSNQFCKECLDSCIYYNLIECPICKARMNNVTHVYPHAQLIVPDYHSHGIVIHIRPNRRQYREISEFALFILLSFSFCIFIRFMIYPMIYHIYTLELHQFR